MDFFGIHWVGVDRFIFLPFFLIIMGLVIYRIKQQNNLIKYLVHHRNMQEYFKHFSFNRQRCKAFLISFALVALFLALMQPQWGKIEENIQQESRDLLIMLDVSRSMLAADCKPNRLACAKLKIRHLLEKLPVDRIGLILFSSTAFVQCPLTLDHAAVFTFLNQVTPETISMGTTSIDAALHEALKIFSQAEGRLNKLALLITDGEDFSVDLSAVQHKAVQENLYLFALGIGTPEGAPIPILDARGTVIGHERDATGAIALSCLNQEKLTALCKELRGEAIIADYDDQDINYLASRIQTFEKESITDKQLSRYDEQYPWLVGAAFLFLALEWIL